MNALASQVWDIHARRELVQPTIDAGLRYRNETEFGDDVPRPPGPSQLRMLTGGMTRRDPRHLLMQQLSYRYSPMAHFRIRGDHAYLLSDPAAIYEALHTNGRFLIKGRALAYLKPLLGNGLLTNEGSDHMRQRRLAAPAFHRDRIADYADQMVDVTITHQSQWFDRQRIDMAASMHALAFKIVGRTLFGADVGGSAADVGKALAEAMTAFQQALTPLGVVLSRLPTRTNRRMEVASDRLDALVQSMIDEHRASGRSDDLLGMLIAAQEEGYEMSDAQLRDEAMTLILAGHETTANALAWAWYLLGQHPAAMRHLQEQADQILGGRDATMADIPSLPFVQACAAETMRLYPPAWTIGRRTTRDLEIAGWQIPAGSLLLASQYAMHRHPDHWADPTQFRPERWLTATGGFDERAPGQPKGAWFPFGFGTRRCIGDQFAWTEATLVLATLARRWTLAPVPGLEVRPDPSITLRPDRPVSMVLHRR